MDTIFHRYLRTEPRKKAIAYYRSAVANPDAIAAQRDSAREFAERYNIDIIHEEIDDGVSGQSTNRPGLKNIFWDWILNDDVPPFDYVLIYDVSRWGRFQDARPIALYEWLCGLRNKEVIYISTFSLSFLQ